MDKLKQFLWRPRPPTLLSRDAQKQIRRALREYSRDFEEEDRIADDKEKGAVVEERRRLFDEWRAWTREMAEEVEEEREALGLGAPDGVEEDADGEPAKVVEEIKEEIVDETEEIIG